MIDYRIAKYIAGSVAALLTVALVVSIGCSPSQGEGNRCNPSLPSVGENDCNSGLACTQPALCAENYCCPVDSKGNPLPSSNPYCQTGCNGGAASLCNAGVTDGGACEFACKNDPGDLMNSSICSGLDGGTTDGGEEGGSDVSSEGSGHDGATEAGGPDGSTDSSSSADGGGGDGSPGATDGSTD